MECTLGGFVILINQLLYLINIHPEPEFIRFNRPYWVARRRRARDFRGGRGG